MQVPNQVIEIVQNSINFSFGLSDEGRLSRLKEAVDRATQEYNDEVEYQESRKRDVQEVTDWLESVKQKAE